MWNLRQIGRLLDFWNIFCLKSFGCLTRYLEIYFVLKPSKNDTRQTNTRPNPTQFLKRTSRKKLEISRCICIYISISLLLKKNDQNNSFNFKNENADTYDNTYLVNKNNSYFDSNYVYDESEDDDSDSDYELDGYKKGTVMNIVGYGIFIDVGLGFNGLLHISQISQSMGKHIWDPSDYFHIGDKVEVKIINVDKKLQKM